MRILVVGQYFWPENFRINEVADALSRSGCSIEVLTGPPNYPDGKVFDGYSAGRMQRERWGAVIVHRVPLIPRGRGSSIRLVGNYFSFVLAACVLGPWLLRRRRFDVVLVYAPGPILQAIPGIVMARLKRAKLVTWVQDLWPENLEATQHVRNRFVLGIVGWLVRVIYRRHDLLLVQSHSFIDPVRRRAGPVPVVYHPNPGDLPSHSAADRADPSLRLNRGFNIVFAGNLGTVQALDTVLDAAERTREHADLWWVIIGSGARSQWLHEEVRRRGLVQVILAGRYAPDAMHGILAQASALLVTLVRSPSMSQTVPSKIQAYLAAGRPIIAALDGEGARVVAEAGAGVICPAEDADALSAAALRLKHMSVDELGRFGECGKRYYRENYDPDVLNARMVSRLQALVGAKSSSA